ncbi:MAG: topoisomerase IV [Clostridiales bacterium]|nr:topoisomerase IV [Clostridiales bacterium]
MREQNLVEQKIVSTLEQNYMPYAMSVIVSRAIPQIDGFKPSHRKLLYTMYKMGLLKGNRTKSANVVGQTMKLNPHGDAAIYETLVRLTRGNGATLHPYIDSKGNFGKQYSKEMKYAASRYTEVKLDEICEEIFRDIDKDTVEFVDNYDGTLKEPQLFPVTFPNILVNSNQGIAVGMASNICSFNLKEVIDATIEYLKDEEVDVLKYLKAPDFSTGGELIFNEKEMRSVYETGRGSFKLRARYKFDKKNSCIEVFEIPYTTTTEAIMDDVISLVKSGKIREIVDIRDETDLGGLKIAIDVKKNTDVDALMKKLYRFTCLEDSFSCNFNILIDAKPRVLGVKDIIKEWSLFRIDCVKRRINSELKDKRDKLHLFRGLKKILLDIDKAVHIVRETKDDKDVVPNLMSGFDIDQVQANFVAEIKLRNLNKSYIINKVEEVGSLEREIEDLVSTYESDKKIKAIIINELGNISKKYGRPRKTQIIDQEDVEELKKEHLIEDYNLKIFLTKHNYLKKIPLTSLRSNPEQKLKEDDRIVLEIDTHNKADLLLFSNKCIVYKMKMYEIVDCKASNWGEYLSNLLSLENGEEIIHVVATDDYMGYMIFGFSNGKVAKVSLDSYKTKTNRKKLANAYSDVSELVYINDAKDEMELVACSSLNKVIVFSTDMINTKSTRNTIGVQVLKEKNGSKMVDVFGLDSANFEDADYYRPKNIPAVGYYLKEEDINSKQISIDNLS